MGEKNRREIVDELGFGFVPNIFDAAVADDHIETALWVPFRQLILHGHLPRTTKEMMGVMISKTNNSPYAAAVHMHALAVQGIDDAVIDAIAREETPDTLPDLTQALLRFAQTTGANPAANASATDELRAAGLSDAEIREAVAVVGLFRMVNAWTDLMKIPIDAI